MVRVVFHLEMRGISKLIMGSDLPSITWYFVSPCNVMAILKAHLDRCPPFKGSLLIVIHLIFSLMLNPTKVGYSAESEVTDKCYRLPPHALILFVDTQKLHRSTPPVQLIMLHRLRAMSRWGCGGLETSMSEPKASLLNLAQTIMAWKFLLPSPTARRLGG